MIRVSPTAAAIEKLPSKSEVTPRFEFSITIVAPGSGIPSASVTFPVTVFCCANPICENKIPIRDKNK